MSLFALPILLSAFLLFQVQPIIAKAILPWFGGSPAVWTTSMMFFQVLLFGGYVYAHRVATSLSSRAQARVHLLLLFAALTTLPLSVDPAWKPTGAEAPAPRILVLLAASDQLLADLHTEAALGWVGVIVGGAVLLSALVVPRRAVV